MPVGERDVRVFPSAKLDRCRYEILKDAVRAATLNPAKAVGLGGQHGALAKGAKADFVVLNRAGEVLKTVVGGRGF